MRSSFVIPAWVCLLAGLPVLAAAADKQASGDAPWRPTALQPEQSLSLLEAVRLTLQNDPNIRLTESQVHQKEGVTQELAGQFDLMLRANGGYQYNREELRDSTKRREQKNRDDLDAIIPRADSVLAGLQRALTNLRNPNAIENPAEIDFTEGVTNPAIANELLKIQNNLILLTELIAQTADPATRLQLEGLRGRVKSLRRQGQAGARDRAVEQARQLAEHAAGNLMIEVIDASDKDSLMAALDVIRARRPEAAAMLFSSDEEEAKVLIAATVPKSIIARGLKAGEWVKHVAAVCGGSGGGKPDTAMAGGKDPAKIGAAQRAAHDFASEKIS